MPRLVEELCTLRTLCAASAEQVAALRQVAELAEAREAALRAELAACRDLEGTQMVQTQQTVGQTRPGYGGSAAGRKPSLFSSAKLTAGKMSFKFPQSGAQAQPAPGGSTP